MAENAVQSRGVTIALACRAFGVSQTCYRYSPKLKPESERIEDLLIGLTKAHRKGASACVFASSQRQTAFVEPQAGLPDLSGT